MWNNIKISVLPVIITLYYYYYYSGNTLAGVHSTKITEVALGTDANTMSVNTEVSRKHVVTLYPSLSLHTLMHV